MDDAPITLCAQTCDPYPQPPSRLHPITLCARTYEPYLQPPSRLHMLPQNPNLEVYQTNETISAKESDGTHPHPYCSLQISEPIEHKRSLNHFPIVEERRFLLRVVLEVGFTTFSFSTHSIVLKPPSAHQWVCLRRKFFLQR